MESKVLDQIRRIHSQLPYLQTCVPNCEGMAQAIKIYEMEEAQKNQLSKKKKVIFERNANGMTIKINNKIVAASSHFFYHVSPNWISLFEEKKDGNLKIQGPLIQKIYIGDCELEVIDIWDSGEGGRG
jgi:hypothetical protein